MNDEQRKRWADTLGGEPPSDGAEVSAMSYVKCGCGFEARGLDEEELTEMLTVHNCPQGGLPWFGGAIMFIFSPVVLVMVLICVLAWLER